MIQLMADSVRMPTFAVVAAMASPYSWNVYLSSSNSAAYLLRMWKSTHISISSATFVNSRRHLHPTTLFEAMKILPNMLNNALRIPPAYIGHGIGQGIARVLKMKGGAWVRELYRFSSEVVRLER